MQEEKKAKYNEIVFTEKELEDIKNSYLNGESSTQIGKKYNTTHKPILKALRKMGVEINNRSDYRKYNLDTCYFDNINSANKAYILGFLFADGHIDLDKCTVTMSLQESDYDILERIRKEINSEKPLDYLNYSNKHDFGYTYSNQYRLNMFSKHMCESLLKLGMYQNKSYNLDFPNIPKDYISHFIRGYFDGNGSIKKKSYCISIVSTYSFVNSINEIIKDELFVENGYLVEAPCKNGITYSLLYTRKEDCEKILNWLYFEKSNMFMERKYNKYVEKYLSE